MSKRESTTTENITNEDHHDIDDDDDQLNVEHKIVPTIYNTTKTEPHNRIIHKERLIKYRFLSRFPIETYS
ncbi:unnamed protein product, partial [Rotaria sp. Silwood1]